MCVLLVCNGRVTLVKLIIINTIQTCDSSCSKMKKKLHIMNYTVAELFSIIGNYSMNNTK